MTDIKLKTENLKQYFPVNTGLVARMMGRDNEMVRAVDGVSLEIKKGESFGIAGESGCGKTTFGKTAIRLLEPTSGKILFSGKDITEISGNELNQFRKEAQIIHQDPYQSLNPRFTVFKWVKEPLDIHGIGTQEERENRVYETLETAGLRPAQEFAHERPPELSGGERQRVGIARGIVLNPSFLLADEPASMLDVSIRASILDVLQNLQTKKGMTSMYISHDLSLLKHMCDRIGIMYLGELVEIGPANQIINNPKHPYTKALVSSVPVIDPDIERERNPLEGEVPDPVNIPNGCRFHPRCPEIVPPEEYEFNQDDWRAVANLRHDLLQGSLSVSGDEDGHTPKSIRASYNVPSQLSDPEAERVLSEALSNVMSDQCDAARELLKREFATICEKPPEMNQITSHQEAKCVLYNENKPGQP